MKRKKEIVFITIIILIIIFLYIGIFVLCIGCHKTPSKSPALLEQAINGMSQIDEGVYEVLSGTGNKTQIDIRIGQGSFYIDGEKDSIYWKIPSEYQYSEIGTPVSAGRMQVTTIKGDPYLVIIEFNYPMDIKVDGKDTIGEISQSSNPTTIQIENLGTQNGKTVINFNILE